MRERKIFNIGFHKTGTTSLTHFMRNQGFEVLHSVSHSMKCLELGDQRDCDEGDGLHINLSSRIDPVLLDNLVRQYDYFSDNPWPLLYRQLDETYPGSLFIFTRRKVDSWMHSLLKYSGNGNTRMRQMIYGYGNPQRHIPRYRQVYLSHNREVEAYFRGRDCFISIDLEDDNLFIAKRLGRFLGIETDNLIFPTLNTRTGG